MTKEEALKWLATIPTQSEQVDALEMAIEALENQKVGHWFIREGGNVCSNCGNTQFKYTSLDFDWRPHYCPNCGADMRGE